MSITTTFLDPTKIILVKYIETYVTSVEKLVQILSDDGAEQNFSFTGLFHLINLGVLCCRLLEICRAAAPYVTGNQ